ncbi:MAG: hypothetical protein CXX71_04025 [Methanobacteriota archaeon]|nr:MAG: hypothetical protein CXX71_04025 [Euryarchaeota archaeon]
MSKVASKWLGERLADWKKRGHDTTTLQQHLAAEPVGASERLLHAEQTIEAAERLRRRLEDMPAAWPERDVLLSRIRDPMNFQTVEREWLQLMRKRRPWHLLADRMRDRWSREGRSQQLAYWVERLDRLDESMIPEAQEVLLLLEQAATEQTLDMAMSNLFDQQERRRVALEQMMNWMREQRGWGTQSITGTLSERYEAAERLLKLDELLLQVQETIDESVGPYDNNAAALLHERAELCQRMEDGQRLRDLLVQVEESGRDHDERLVALQDEHARLRTTGFHLDARNPLRPADLLAHEVGLDGLHTDVARMRRAWSALIPIAQLFPEAGAELSALEGQVHLVVELESLLSELTDRRDEREQQAHDTLAAWEENGVDTEPWKTLLARDPRLAWGAVQEHDSRVRVCIDLLRTADRLDISFRGAEEAEDWRTLLHSAEVTADDVGLVQQGIQRRVVRNERHRNQLDEERDGLAHIWPQELDAAQLSLAEYERVVTELQAGDASAEVILESTLAGRRDRLLDQSQVELDLWASRGWDVVRLQERLQRDANGLWLELPDMRAAIDRYDLLRPRLLALPLGREQELLDEVRRHSRRPEHLQGLWEDIPQFALRLAGLEPVDDDHLFALFEPSLPEPFTKLHPYASDSQVLWPTDYTDVELEQPPTHSEQPPIHSDTPSEVEDVRTDIQMEAQTVAAEIARFEVPVERLLALLGTDANSIEGVSSQLEEAGASDRDLRVARLCRLTTKLLTVPSRGGHAERLTRVCERLQRWTCLRLERRHTTTEGGLLRTSERLASKLYGIPGPGVQMPRGPDISKLPELSETTAFEAAISLLENSADLPYAGSRQAAEAAP